jgi:hypothetical protein
MTGDMPLLMANWDVDFTLHAPGQTVLEGSVRNGRVVNLKVDPVSRMKDVEGRSK